MNGGVMNNNKSRYQGCKKTDRLVDGQATVME